MIRKFFPRDKNYILESVQLSMQDTLLEYLVDFVKVEYLMQSNPLGVMDDSAVKIKDYQETDFTHLHDFYFNLCGVYRYHYYHDNQLEFIFDGRNDYEKYSEEWSKQFKAWTKEFCKNQLFIRAVLDLTVFYPSDSAVLMVDNRMNNFLTQFFEVRIHPQKGIIRKTA